jgi:hypothetical protein
MAAHGVEKTPAEIDRALTVLAYYGGNTARTGRELGMSRATLHLWKTDSHRDRYLEIAEREGPRIEAQAAAQARELIIRSADVEHTILDRLAGEDDVEPTTKELSELAGALQRVTTSKGINTTKLLELTGRPTAIVEHRDPKQAAAALSRRLGVIIESTAEDVSATPLLSESQPANAREPQHSAVSPTS